MARKKRITNTTLVLTAVIGSISVLAMMFANNLWDSKLSKDVTNDAVSAVSAFYLEAMADQRSKAVTNLINNNFEELETAIAFIDSETIDSQEKLRNTIGKMESLLGLKRFALVDTDNIVYTQYTTYTGGSRHSFLEEETIKARTISTVSLYGSSKQLCLAIPTPGLSIMGKPFRACFVQLDIRDIVDLLAFDDQGRTHFALYSKNGGNLSGTQLGHVIAGHNLLDSIHSVVSEEVWNESRENFENGKGGSVSFVTGDGMETLYYVPIEETGWEMAVLICESVIQVQIRDISQRLLVASRNKVSFTLVSVLLLASVIFFEIRKMTRDRLEAEQETSRTFRNMASTDSLTGVRNKHAYSEYETALNQQIQTGQIEKLAVVVGDINGLKRVNDTQGHTAGDQLIKDACALICEYFTHGSVFRVGGDEFVVVLQGKGYDTMNAVMDELNQKIEENIANGAVVISIGCAVLTQKDQLLRDVFDRADQMMYERKKALNAMGAPRRR